MNSSYIAPISTSMNSIIAPISTSMNSIWRFFYHIMHSFETDVKLKLFGCTFCWYDRFLIFFFSFFYHAFSIYLVLFTKNLRKRTEHSVNRVMRYRNGQHPHHHHHQEIRMTTLTLRYLFVRAGHT